MADDAPEFNVHHATPLFFGDYEHLLPTPDPPRLPHIDERRARQPKNPGLPAEMHLSLDVLAQLQHVVPPPEDPNIIIQDEPDIPERPLLPSEQAALEAAETAHLPKGVLSVVDPAYTLALYFALGLGTLFLPLGPGVRSALLWGVLALVGALYMTIDAPAPEPVYGSDVLWGFGAGMIVGLPLLILTGAGLATTARLMFPGVEVGAIIAYVAFAAPLAETLFFRGVIQGARGIPLAIGAAGANSALLFWPGLLMQGEVGFAVLVGVFFTALAGLYSIIRARYGRPAALVCQVTTNVTLLVLPLLLITERIP